MQRWKAFWRQHSPLIFQSPKHWSSAMKYSFGRDEFGSWHIPCVKKSDWEGKLREGFESLMWIIANIPDCYS
jgi:hypothetical protein